MKVLLYATQNRVNLGNIVRTSACFGMKEIYLYDLNRLLSNIKACKKIKKIAGGYAAEVEIKKVEAPLEFILSHENRFAIVPPNDAYPVGMYGQDKFPEDSLFVFGCEKTGLPEEIKKFDGMKRITIPMTDQNHCLNLSVAYSIVIYEYLRQHPAVLSRL